MNYDDIEALPASGRHALWRETLARASLALRHRTGLPYIDAVYEDARLGVLIDALRVDGVLADIDKPAVRCADLFASSDVLGEEGGAGAHAAELDGLVHAMKALAALTCVRVCEWQSAQGQVPEADPCYELLMAVRHMRWADASLPPLA